MAFDAEKVGAALEHGHLTYVNDNDPGISRRRAGKSFSYRWPDGARIFLVAHGEPREGLGRRGRTR